MDGSGSAAAFRILSRFATIKTLALSCEKNFSCERKTKPYLTEPTSLEMLSTSILPTRRFLVIILGLSLPLCIVPQNPF